jgi:hypothetical protein
MRDLSCEVRELERSASGAFTMVSFPTFVPPFDYIGGEYVAIAVGGTIGAGRRVRWVPSSRLRS